METCLLVWDGQKKKLHRTTSLRWNRPRVLPAQPFTSECVTNGGSRILLQCRMRASASVVLLTPVFLLSKLGVAPSTVRHDEKIPATIRLLGAAYNAEPIRKYGLSPTHSSGFEPLLVPAHAPHPVEAFRAVVFSSFFSRPTSREGRDRLVLALCDLASIRSGVFGLLGFLVLCGERRFFVFFVQAGSMQRAKQVFEKLQETITGLVIGGIFLLQG